MEEENQSQVQTNAAKQKLEKENSEIQTRYVDDGWKNG